MWWFNVHPLLYLEWWQVSRKKNKLIKRDWVVDLILAQMVICVVNV